MQGLAGAMPLAVSANDPLATPTIDVSDDPLCSPAIGTSEKGSAAAGASNAGAAGGRAARAVASVFHRSTAKSHSSPDSPVRGTSDKAGATSAKGLGAGGLEVVTVSDTSPKKSSQRAFKRSASALGHGHSTGTSAGSAMVVSGPAVVEQAVETVVVPDEDVFKSSTAMQSHMHASHDDARQRTASEPMETIENPLHVATPDRYNPHVSAPHIDYACIRSHYRWYNSHHSKGTCFNTPRLLLCHLQCIHSCNSSTCAIQQLRNLHTCAGGPLTQPTWHTPTPLQPPKTPAPPSSRKPAPRRHLLEAPSLDPSAAPHPPASPP